MAYVVISLGGEEVSRHPLMGTTVIGRSVDSAVAVRDASMSRWHCRIEEDEESGEWVAVDLGSRNGTTLNGRKVVRHPLHDGDLLRMGRVTAYFSTGQFVPAPPKLTVPEGTARPKVPSSAGAPEPSPAWTFESRLPRPSPATQPCKQIDYDLMDVMSSPGWSRQLRKPPSPSVAADTPLPVDEPQAATMDLADEDSSPAPGLVGKMTSGIRSLFGR